MGGFCEEIKERKDKEKDRRRQQQELRLVLVRRQGIFDKYNFTTATTSASAATSATTTATAQSPRLLHPTLGSGTLCMFEPWVQTLSPLKFNSRFNKIAHD